MEADAYTVDGATLDEYIADTVGAMVGSNTETGITVTYQDGDNTLDFVIGTLNQNTTGTSDNFTVTANNSADETVYPVFVDGTTGSQGAETDTGLTYNPSTGLITTAAVTTTGDVTVAGNADIDGTTNLDAVDIDGAVQIDNTVTVGVDGQGYDFKLFGDTASAYMLWDTSADDLILGGAATLHIEGANTGGTASSAADSLIVERSTTVGMTLMTDNSGVARIMFADAAANNSGQIQYSHVSNFMSFATAATEAMRIDSSGRLGVGDSSPNTGAKMTVTGSDSAVGSLNYIAAIRNSDAYSTTPAGGILFQNKYNSAGAYADAGGIEVVKENATDGEYGFGLGLHTRANGASITEKLHITGAGNVGIGTATPATELDVNGDVTVTGDLTLSGDDLTMATNTSGAALIADGTNFNPVVISGDISINASGVAAIGSAVIVEADIADNAVTLAKMAGGTDGNIISFDASGNPVAVATGTDGQVLTSAGAGAPPAFEDAAGGGGAWNLLETQNPSNVATVDMVTTIDSTYSRYYIEITDVVPATDGVQFMARISDDGGSTWKEGATDYEYSTTVWTNYSNDSEATRSTGDTAFRLTTDTSNEDMGSDGGKGGTFTVTLSNPANTSLQQLVMWKGQWDTPAGSGHGVAFGGGNYSTAAAIDGIQFLMSSGNVESGKFSLYGLSM
jgi:hypothetical protein